MTSMPSTKKDRAREIRSMKNLFKRCLSADYNHTAEGGDYAIQIEGDTLYILFEWSDGKEDWINNFDFPVKPYKETNWYCHRGFLKVWKAMRVEIESNVADILSNEDIKNITCIGYSHGAALSVLCTEDMEYWWGSQCKVNGYGFGAPRVLWGIVPKAVKERLRSFKTVRNKPDLVTHVPPKIFGYRNAGELIKIGKDFKYSPIKAHYPESYIKELESIVL